MLESFCLNLIQFSLLILWTVFFIYPLYWLSNRRLLETSLATTTSLLVYAHLARMAGIYNWQFLAIIHLLTSALWFSLKYLIYLGKARSSGLPGSDLKSFLRKHRQSPDTQPWPGSGKFIYCVIASGAVLLLGILLNLQTPATGWDALTYHLEFPQQWLDAGQLQLGSTAFGDLSPPYYPMLAELWIGWLLAPGLGSSLAELSQVFWAIVFYLLTREIVYHYFDQLISKTSLEVSERLRLELLALIFLAWPWVQSSILVADNDIALLAGLAALWLASLRFLKYKKVYYIYMMVLCLGVCASIKTMGLVYALALLAGLLWPQLRCLISAVRNTPVVGLHILASIATFCVTGGFWYLRNYLLSGNPLWPASISLAGWQIFEGYYPAEFYNTHPFHQITIVNFIKDPGVFLLMLMLLCLAFAALLRGDSPLTTRQGLKNLIKLSVLPISATLAFIFIIPLHQTRLSLPIWYFSLPIFLMCIMPAPRRENPPEMISLFIKFIKFFIKPSGIMIAFLLLAIIFNLVRFQELYDSILQPRLSNTELSSLSLVQAWHNPIQFGWFMLGWSGLTILLWSGWRFWIYYQKIQHSNKLKALVISSCILLALCVSAMLINRRSNQMLAHPGHEFGQANAALIKHINQSAPAMDSQQTTIYVHGANAIFNLRGLDQTYQTRWLMLSAEQKQALHVRRPRLIYIEQDNGWFEINAPHARQKIAEHILSHGPGYYFINRTKPDWGFAQITLASQSQFELIYSNNTVKIYYRKEVRGSQRQPETM